MEGNSASIEESYRSVLRAMPPIETFVEDDTLHVTRAFRGMTLEQAIGYLVSLGGIRTGEATVEGSDWEATLSAERVPVGPSYRLTEVTVEWIGDVEALEPVIYRFRRKAFRAPG